MYTTRITERMMNDNVIQVMLSNRNKLNELQEQIASGKKITTPSDDPNAAISILSNNTSLQQIENYTTNINYAISEVETADNALLSAIEIVHQAKELTVKAANATSGSSELKAINSQVEQLISQLKDLGNTQFNNKYLFGGLNTQTAPFQSVGAGGDEVAYIGTAYSLTGEYERKVEISPNITAVINVAGNQVFGQYTSGPPEQKEGLFNTLKELSSALTAEPPDYNDIRSKIDDLDDNLTTLLDSQAKLGGVMSKLEATKNKLEEDTITFTKFKSNYEDIDLAKTISDMQFQQTALEASLSASARVLQQSLLNYI